MYKEYLERIASVVLLAGLFLILPGQAYKTQAQFVIPSGIPFAGSVVEFVPPTPLCPVAHTIVANYMTGSPLPITVVPTSQVYERFNLYTKGTLVLGTFLVPPIPCPMYPIFPISQVGTS